MTTIHLVRHAEKAAPENVLSGRTPGIALTARGRAQAEALARHFAAHTPAAVYASPLDRAQETADAIAGACALEVRTDARFQEFDFGEWTGRTFAQLQADPRWTLFNEHRSLGRAPGGESMLQVQARFVAGLSDLVEQHAGATLVVASHADPIRAAVMYFVGCPVDAWSRFDIDLASITTLRFGDGAAQLVALNATVWPHGAPT